jgi:hypothetical protein
VRFLYNDGGRAQSGRRGDAGDCVTRAIAIAAGLSYESVYASLADGNAAERVTKRSAGKSGRRTASSGIRTKRQWFKTYMQSLGFTWGCQ